MKKFSTYLFGFSKTDKAINKALEGGGAVNSVNGKTGTVVLNASDVGALGSSTYYAKSASQTGNTLSIGFSDNTGVTYIPHLYVHRLYVQHPTTTAEPNTHYWTATIVNSDSTPIDTAASLLGVLTADVLPACGFYYHTLTGLQNVIGVKIEENIPKYVCYSGTGNLNVMNVALGNVTVSDSVSQAVTEVSPEPVVLTNKKGGKKK